MADNTPDVRLENGRIDWEPIKQAYISDPTQSYRSLEEKFKVTRKAIESRSKKENWVKLRQELGKKTETAFMENVAEQRAKLDKKHSRLYNRGQRLVVKTMKYLEEGEIVFDKDGNAVVDAKGKPIRAMPSAKMVEHLMKALKVTIDGERAVAGLPSDVKGLTGGKGESLAEGLAEVFDRAEKKYEELRKNGSLATEPDAS